MNDTTATEKPELEEAEEPRQGIPGPPDDNINHFLDGHPGTYTEQEARRRDALVLAFYCIRCGHPWSEYEAMAENVRKYLSGSEAGAP